MFIPHFDLGILICKQVYCHKWGVEITRTNRRPAGNYDTHYIGWLT